MTRRLPRGGRGGVAAGAGVGVGVRCRSRRRWRSVSWPGPPAFAVRALGWRWTVTVGILDGRRVVCGAACGVRGAGSGGRRGCGSCGAGVPTPAGVVVEAFRHGVVCVCDKASPGENQSATSAELPQEESKRLLEIDMTNNPHPTENNPSLQQSPPVHGEN